MFKTYLYLPENLEEKIKYTSAAQKKSKAEVMRQALEKGIADLQREGSASAQTLLKLAELGKKHKLRGPKNSSVRMNELLWGKDWNKDE